MSRNKFGEFFDSSAVRETVWYVVPDTNEFVGRCESCGVEVRFTTDHRGELQFAHKDSCPHSDNERAVRLVKELLNIVAEETDNNVMLSSVIFLSALMCLGAAGADEVPLDIMAKRFISEFEQRLALLDRLSSDENAA